MSHFSELHVFFCTETPKNERRHWHSWAAALYLKSTSASFSRKSIVDPEHLIPVLILCVMEDLMSLCCCVVERKSVSGRDKVRHGSLSCSRVSADSLSHTCRAVWPEKRLLGAVESSPNQRSWLSCGISLRERLLSTWWWWDSLIPGCRNRQGRSLPPMDSASLSNSWFTFAFCASA